MTLQTAAQKALSTLESGELLCELTAASMLRVALADEQAQAVEHVGVFDIAVTEKMAVIDYDCTKHSLKSGDKLYTHPAPPVVGERDHCERALNMVGERAQVGDSKFESWYSELNQAGKGSKQIAREAYEAGMNEAQQAAVPAGWALVPIEPTPEMLRAAMNAPMPAVWLDSISARANLTSSTQYKAMLAAAQGAKK